VRNHSAKPTQRGGHVPRPRLHAAHLVGRATNLRVRDAHPWVPRSPPVVRHTPLRVRGTRPKVHAAPLQVRPAPPKVPPAPPRVRAAPPGYFG